MSKVIDLLHEYQEILPTKFSYMKVILGYLGVIKIPLKLDVKPVRKRPYRLNLKYKDKVKLELDKMIATWIIEPVKKSEWVIPMVV